MREERTKSEGIRRLVALLTGLLLILSPTGAAIADAAEPTLTEEPDSGEGPRSPYSVLGEAVYDSPAPGLADNLRWVIDLYSQINQSTDTGEFSWQHIGGLDLTKVFSDAGGDWGTLVVQLYLVGLDGASPYPYTYEYDEHDDSQWQLVTRNTNFNYTGLCQGRLNVRVGHFELPYGLEVPINTNGSLRQLISERNLYMKSDWGVSLNGVLPEFEYEVSLTRGSGNEYFDQGQPGLVTGRIGIPGDHLTLGLSAFAGKIHTHYGIRDRTRFGSDFQWQGGPLGFLGELSLGEDEKREVINSFFEVNWNSPDETLLLYVQNQLFHRRETPGWERASVVITGIQFAPNATWALSAQFYQDITTFGTADRDGIWSVQGRLTF